MARNFMAHPEHRHPFEETPIHPEGSATILYEGRRITLAALGMGDRLLIRPEDLASVNGFEIKPEGACYEDLCVPLGASLYVEADGRRWFDLTAFADLLEQPWVADAEARVWSFAEMPAKRAGMMVDAQAPDFEVTDRSGNVVRMSDFRGRKALVVTWSSW
jgi:hypothetical protein